MEWKNWHGTQVDQEAPRFPCVVRAEGQSSAPGS